MAGMPNSCARNVGLIDAAADEFAVLLCESVEGSYVSRAKSPTPEVYSPNASPRSPGYGIICRRRPARAPTISRCLHGGLSKVQQQEIVDSSKPHLDVGDKANDAVRVDAADVHVRVIAEEDNPGAALTDA